MKVVIVENEEIPAQAVEFAVRMEGGFEPVVYPSVPSAQKALEGSEDPFIVLLDHDLGHAEQQGYVLCAWLREVHPLGLLLPIIYLTGRETPEGFYSRQQVQPFVHPTMYLNKIDMDRVLPNLLQRCREQFDEIRRWSDRQAAARALLLLSSSAFPDDAG